MAAKTQAVMRADILTDLSGVADTEWNDTELNRAIERAVADMSRFLPQQLVYEHTLDFDEVTDETVTLTAHGTYKALANKPVLVDSERICDDAAETTKYTRDTDYTIDYTNGRITSISGGSIGATATIYCNYTVNKVIVDISSLTGFIRHERVEYPVGNIPMTFVPVDKWGDFLIVTSLGEDSQEQMSSKKHIAVHYHAGHTPPTDSVAGTYPIFLENTVILAASAYALFHKAAEAEHQAIDNMNLLIPAVIKIGTYLDNNSDDDAVAILANVTDDVADLRTAIATAVDAANSYLDEVDTTDLAGAEAVWADEEMHIRENIKAGACTTDTAFRLTDSNAPFTAADVGKIAHNVTDDTWGVVVGYVSTTVLDISSDLFPDGDEKYTLYHANIQAFIADAFEKVNTITSGKDVPERIMTLAQLAAIQQAAWRAKRQDWIALATVRSSAAIGYIQEATARLANLRTYVEESAGWGIIARGFAEQASLYFNAVQAQLLIAQQFRTEAMERRNEAWSIWRDGSQYMGDFAYTSLRQPKS